MNTLEKGAGFEGQKMFVLPKNMLKKLKKHPIGELLYITDIGYFPRAKEHFRTRPKGAGQYILIFCIEGQGDIIIDEQKVSLSTNQFCLIPEKTSHSYASSKHNPWSIYWVHFQGTKVNEVCKQIPLYGDVLLRESTKAGRETLFNEFFDILNKGVTLDRMLYIGMCFWSLLSSFAYASLYTDMRAAEVNLVNTMTDFLKENIDKILKLEDLVAHAGCSSTHLYTLFKKETGHSPINFFILLKMQEACRYLSFSNQSIKEISFALGYDDQYYFSRLFKKIIGISPRNYRKKD